MTALEEFYASDWFKERPEAVQALFRAYPIDQEHFLAVGGDPKLGYYGCYIICIDEEKNGELTFRIVREDPLHALSYQVFGIKPADLYKREDISEEKIRWHSDDRRLDHSKE